MYYYKRNQNLNFHFRLNSRTPYNIGLWKSSSLKFDPPSTNEEIRALPIHQLPCYFCSILYRNLAFSLCKYCLGKIKSYEIHLLEESLEKNIEFHFSLCHFTSVMQNILDVSCLKINFACSHLTRFLKSSKTILQWFKILKNGLIIFKIQYCQNILNFKLFGIFHTYFRIFKSLNFFFLFFCYDF